MNISYKLRIENRIDTLSMRNKMPICIKPRSKRCPMRALMRERNAQ